MNVADHTLLLILFVLSGAILIVLSIPLIQGRIGPNIWYGFRVPRTLNDPKLWYPVNAYAAWRFLWLGVMEIAAAIALYFVPEIDVDTYAWIFLAVTICGILLVIILSFRQLNRLARENADS